MIKNTFDSVIRQPFPSTDLLYRCALNLFVNMRLISLFDRCVGKIQQGIEVKIHDV
jgi:hypothetical protein